MFYKYCFLLCSSENLFMAIGDVIASEGYREAGWQFVVIGDCWLSRQRDSQGKLQADPKRFPHGIPHLANFVRFYCFRYFLMGTCDLPSCKPEAIGYLSESWDCHIFKTWDFQPSEPWNCHLSETHGLKIMSCIGALYKVFQFFLCFLVKDCFTRSQIAWCLMVIVTLVTTSLLWMTVG